MILDSGERRVFDTGAVRDMCLKGRTDLLPWDVIGEFMGDRKEFCVPMYHATHKENVEYWLSQALGEFISIAYEGCIPTALLEVSYQYQEGAEKYAPRNWELGIDLDSFLDSAGRHFLKYMRGDTDERHDRAVVWNLLGALWTIKHKGE